jgi:hypothetical protein
MAKEERRARKPLFSVPAGCSREHRRGDINFAMGQRSTKLSGTSAKSKFHCAVPCTDGATLAGFSLAQAEDR